MPRTLIGALLHLSLPGLQPKPLLRRPCAPHPPFVKTGLSSAMEAMVTSTLALKRLSRYTRQLVAPSRPLKIRSSCGGVKGKTVSAVCAVSSQLHFQARGQQARRAVFTVPRHGGALPCNVWRTRPWLLAENTESCTTRCCGPPATNAVPLPPHGFVYSRVKMPCPSPAHTGT